MMTERHFKKQEKGEEHEDKYEKNVYPKGAPPKPAAMVLQKT